MDLNSKPSCFYTDELAEQDSTFSINLSNEISKSVISTTDELSKLSNAINKNILPSHTTSNKAWKPLRTDDEISTTSSGITFTSQAQASKFYTIPSDQLTIETKPWSEQPHFFHTVHISILALLKMAIHARSGGSIEIMGMMTGKIYESGDMVILDSYPLPVQGTESRVNPLNEAYEFMLNYLADLKKCGHRGEDIIGWYHSHPGFGCWLSGIDIQTQLLNQKFQDPYVAVVIDPEKTNKQGFVEIGAFRTYFEDKKPQPGDLPPLAGGEKLGNVGLSSSRLKDFGHHADEYYALRVRIFKSEQDDAILKMLESKYWFSGLVELRSTDEVLKIEKIKQVTEMIKRQKSLCIKPGKPINPMPPSTASSTCGGYQFPSTTMDFTTKMKKFNKSLSELSSPTFTGEEVRPHIGGGALYENMMIEESAARLVRDLDLIGVEELKSYLLEEMQEDLFL